MEAIKQVWPQWRITETIGAGQYGRVYRAVREESGVRFTSAIKEINIPNGDAEIRELRNAGLTDQAIENYFEEKKNSVINEIRLMESLKSSDGIVSIEDYGCVKREHAPGWIVYIRMELLESLSHYRTRHTITEQEVLQIGLEISAALMDCARYQIIHRDIKWDNIFRSEFGHYKLGDFGVSRQLEHTSSAGTMIGTATYMAPEIMRMEAYDHRVDLYALGLVLYRLLNGGRFPFVSESPTPAEMELASIRRLRGDALPLPCEADPELGRIINRACAHRKEDRILLRVPAIDARYEVLIPTEITVGSLKQLLISSVEEITNGQYCSSGTELLCRKEQGLQLREELPVSAYGIQNGELLFLI